MRIKRFSTNPIIRPDMDASMGTNVNGPSLIRVPDWLPNPLGRYYLYFAHHRGTYIRLAYADRLAGPWRTHEPGTLQLADTPCGRHIASPDVHVDDQRREIRMYYHGDPADRDHAAGRGQRSFVARSRDGIHFDSGSQILGNPYFRVFTFGGVWHAMGMPGTFYRSADGLADFVPGPTLLSPNIRHSAVRVIGDRLEVYHSRYGDRPEHILLSTVELTDNWTTWRADEPISVLQPETDYEGADLPLEPSIRGWAPEPVRQLRDPGIYQEDGKTYLLYAVAGEHGLAIAEMTDD